MLIPREYDKQNNGRPELYQITSLVNKGSSIVYCTLYTVHCTMYNIQHIMYCIMYSIHYTVYNTVKTMYT